MVQCHVADPPGPERFRRSELLQGNGQLTGGVGAIQLTLGHDVPVDEVGSDDRIPGDVLGPDS